MKNKIITIIGALFLAAIAVAEAAVSFDGAPVVEATTSQSNMVSDLTTIATMPYVSWSAPGAYEGLQAGTDYDWMNWSQDGCSGPSVAHFGYGDSFLMGCLRHDLLWRSMAVADNADGSVWNERNRLFADKLFKKDHYAFCDAEFNNGVAHCSGAGAR